MRIESSLVQNRQLANGQWSLLINIKADGKTYRFKNPPRFDTEEESEQVGQELAEFHANQTDFNPDPGHWAFIY